MVAALHRVRRQSWRLRVGSRQDAFAARARFRSEVEDLLPAFNRAFDAWTPGGELLRIPRLELRLRIGSLDELERALGEALLREAPRRSRAPGRPDTVRLAVLLRYLRTGALEWHALRLEAAAVATELRATALAEQGAVIAHVSAVAVPRDRVLFITRLLQLLPEMRWSELARRVGGAATSSATVRQGNESETAVTDLAGARASLGAYRAQQLAALALAVASAPQAEAVFVREQLAAALGVPVEAPEGVLAAAVRELPAAAARFLLARAGLPAAAPQDRKAKPSSSVSRESGIEAAPAPESARPGAPPPHARAERAAKARRAEVPLAAEADTETAGNEPRDAEPAPPFALMASNAGLVLLHPFLPQLLEARGLWRRRELLAPPRAAALLHWLATGADEPYEFELPAVKILLGLRPEAPLPVGADLLAQADRDEGAALLSAVIAHWKVLKGTSIDGLRVSFLRRRGALREDDEGWRLQPEPESFDVLLKHLPWGISTVKLPWMTRPLYTDWPTP